MYYNNNIIIIYEKNPNAPIFFLPDFCILLDFFLMNFLRSSQDVTGMKIDK